MKSFPVLCLVSQCTLDGGSNLNIGAPSLSEATSNAVVGGGSWFECLRVSIFMVDAFLFQFESLNSFEF